MLDVPYSNQMSARQRLGAFAAFPGWAFIKGLRLPRPDLIYGISTPLTTGLAAAVLALLYGRPWIFEIRDLWPDFPIQMGAISQPILQWGARALERFLYRRAEHVVTVSPGMTAHVRTCGINPQKITTVLPGTDFTFLDDGDSGCSEQLRQQYGLNDRALLLYAGTFGRANDIPTVLAAAERLASRTDHTFVFMGQGYYESRIRDAAHALPNVRVLPPQPHHRIHRWFKAAALALVPFIDLPVLRTNAPSKFYDSLSAGTPVIVTNPGWTKAFVETHDCGWYVPPERPERLAARIAHLLDPPAQLQAAGQRGAEAARHHFDRNANLDQLAATVEAVYAHASP